MENLRYISIFGVASIIVFIIGVIAIYITSRIDGIEMHEMVAFPTNWFKAASAAVNIVFAFDYQMNFFPIYKGMKDVTDKRFEKACLVGIIGCTIPYITVGMLGYSLVGNSKANFL